MSSKPAEPAKGTPTGTQLKFYARKTVIKDYVVPETTIDIMNQAVFYERLISKLNKSPRTSLSDTN